MTKKPSDDEEDEKTPWLPHPGDIGTVLLACVFLVGMLFMVFSPSPLKGIFKPQPKAKPDVVDVSIQQPN